MRSMLAICLAATIFATPLGAQGVDFRSQAPATPPNVQGVDFRVPPTGATPVGVARPVGPRPRPRPAPHPPIPILLPPMPYPYPVPAPQPAPAHRPVDQQHVLVGATIGAGFGVIVGYAAQPTPLTTRVDQALLSGAIFGLIGAGIGSLVR